MFTLCRVVGSVAMVPFRPAEGIIGWLVAGSISSSKSYFVRSRTGRAVSSFSGVTSPLVSLHVASDAKGFATASVRTLEWFLACVAVAVDFETAGAGKRFSARGTDVAVLNACVVGLVVCDVVVVFPRVVRGNHAWWKHRRGDHCWWEIGG